MSRKLGAIVGVCATLWLGGCSDDAPEPMAPGMEPVTASASNTALIAEVRRLAGTFGMTPMPRPAPVRRELSLLGQALAFDKVLSGGRDISCMTCHLTALGTTDGHSVAIGQGATGLGPTRVHPQGKFVHRNSPGLFNLHNMSVLTWDGRVFTDANGIARGPASFRVEQRAVMQFGALSALPMFPVLSRSEMRGDTGNELAVVSDASHQRVWFLLMRRLAAIPEYRTMFESAYPGTAFDSMNFAHAANAMGGWISAVFSSTNTPWDRFLGGEDAALTEAQLRGALAFMSTARCARCHNGPSLSDRKFHNVAVPQIGPGFGDGPNGLDDFGRMRKTGREVHRYAFRTPPLRNVELTAPYGHDGAIVTLRGWVDHYSNSADKLRNYNPGQVEPLLQNTLLATAADILLTRDTKLNSLVIQPQVVDEITEFLKALTDPAARDLRGVVPARVPSGLTIDASP